MAWLIPGILIGPNVLRKKIDIYWSLLSENADLSTMWSLMTIIVGLVSLVTTVLYVKPTGFTRYQKTLSRNGRFRGYLHKLNVVGLKAPERDTVDFGKPHCLHSLEMGWGRGEDWRPLVKDYAYDYPGYDEVLLRKHDLIQQYT